MVSRSSVTSRIAEAKTTEAMSKEINDGLLNLIVICPVRMLMKVTLNLSVYKQGMERLKRTRCVTNLEDFTSMGY